jgi:HNH endonuclease
VAKRAALTARLRDEIIWSGPCAYCGDEAQLQVDHVIPLSRGGTDDRDNLRPACKRCNMEKLDFTPQEWREYREQEGLGWPPESGSDIIKRLFAELRAKFPDQDVDAAIRRSLHREHERRRAKEIRDEIAQLELRREQAEQAIRNNLYANLRRLLGSIDSFDARITELNQLLTPPGE